MPSIREGKIFLLADLTIGLGEQVGFSSVKTYSRADNPADVVPRKKLVVEGPDGFHFHRTGEGGRSGLPKPLKALSSDQRCLIRVFHTGVLTPGLSPYFEWDVRTLQAPW